MDFHKSWEEKIIITSREGEWICRGVYQVRMSTGDTVVYLFIFFSH
jgi:hypothetical protein